MRTFSKSEVSDYEIAPQGAFPGILVGWAELGLQATPFGNKQQVGLIWELSERGSDGRGLSVTEVLTLSFNERARLYQRVVALCGGREPPAGFDLSNLLGRAVILTTAHVSRGERVYCNVTACGPMPKGFAVPTPTIQPLWYETDHHDEATFALLPARFRRLIESQETSAPPAAGAQQRGQPPRPQQANVGWNQPPAPQGGIPFDDDIPF